MLAVGVALNFEALAGSRQLQLFDLDNASSWIFRQKLTMDAWKQISADPLFGLYGGHFFIGEDKPGGYHSHNALSAWVSFGIIGFTLYISLSVIAAWSSLAAMLRKEITSRWLFAAYVSISSLVLISASKSVFWPIVALGWALAANATLDDRNTRRLKARAVLPPQ